MVHNPLYLLYETKSCGLKYSRPAACLEWWWCQISDSSGPDRRCKCSGMRWAWTELSAGPVPVSGPNTTVLVIWIAHSGLDRVCVCAHCQYAFKFPSLPWHIETFTVKNVCHRKSSKYGWTMLWNNNFCFNHKSALQQQDETFYLNYKSAVNRTDIYHRTE